MMPNMKMVALMETLMKRHVFFCSEIDDEGMLSLHNFHKYQTLWWIKTMLKLNNEKPLKWENIVEKMFQRTKNGKHIRNTRRIIII